MSPFIRRGLLSSRLFSLERRALQRCQHKTDPRRSITSFPVLAAVNEATTSFTPVSLIELALGTVQSTAGLPWWLTIVSCTVAMRTACTLPLAIQQRRRIERLSNVQPILQGWKKTYQQQLKSQNETLSPVAVNKMQEMVRWTWCAIPTLSSRLRLSHDTLV